MKFHFFPGTLFRYEVQSFTEIKIFKTSQQCFDISHDDDRDTKRMKTNTQKQVKQNESDA